MAMLASEIFLREKQQIHQQIIPQGVLSTSILDSDHLELDHVQPKRAENQTQVAEVPGSTLTRETFYCCFFPTVKPLLPLLSILADF